MKKELTLASLFDGSGGFTQAAIINGIRPLWSSEIEPFPALVTYKRLPDVPNLGDVRKIDGSKVPPVDVITFGSPCQDLSSSGRRAGIIEGERSSLFFEALRIIREMREASGRFPRFAVWENVPGALSSNGGNDFLEVLRSFVSLWGDNDENIKFNRYNGGGRRSLRPSGILRGRRSSLAWRVLNAQFFGVPQRRCRVFLVCDFGGRSAEKLLFDEREEPFGARTVFSKWQTFAGLVPCGGPEASPIAEDAETDVPPFVVHQQYFTFIPSGEISPTIRRSNSTAIRVFWKGRLRNLTPKEYCALQGFPRDYCEGLAIEEPTDAEVETFGRYFETVGRKKTEKEIRRWLRAPYSAGAEFQLWGNGVALPVIVFVLSQLVEYLKEEEWTK